MPSYYQTQYSAGASAPNPFDEDFERPVSNKKSMMKTAGIALGVLAVCGVLASTTTSPVPTIEGDALAQKSSKDSAAAAKDMLLKGIDQVRTKVKDFDTTSLSAGSKMKDAKNKINGIIGDLDAEIRAKIDMEQPKAVALVAGDAMEEVRVETCLQSKCNTAMSGVSMNWADMTSKNLVHCLSQSGGTVEAGGCFGGLDQPSATVGSLHLCAACNGCVEVKGKKPSKKDCAALPKSWADTRGIPPGVGMGAGAGGAAFDWGSYVGMGAPPATVSAFAAAQAGPYDWKKYQGANSKAAQQGEAMGGAATKQGEAMAGGAGGAAAKQGEAMGGAAAKQGEKAAAKDEAAGPGMAGPGAGGFDWQKYAGGGKGKGGAPGGFDWQKYAGPNGFDWSKYVPPGAAAGGAAAGPAAK